MKKILRLSKEFLRSVLLYKNFWTYCFLRAGLLRQEKVSIRLRNGLIYSISTATNQAVILNEIWSLKIYDELIGNIRDNSTVIDIGANIGVFSLKAARSARNVKVVSYEPFPKNFALLEENIKLNDLGGSVIPLKKAVAGSRGEVELFFGPNDSGNVSSHWQEHKGHAQSIRVPAVTLEDVFRENQIESCDFMKIDCEGAEEEIMLGAPKDIFRRIKSITLEWHDGLNKMTINEFALFLESSGYRTRYSPSTQTLCAWRD